MELRAGSRLRSAVCETAVIVVRAPGEEVEVWCGGHPMVPIEAEVGPVADIDPNQAGGTVLGKRYADEDLGLELLCTKAGKGSLSISGVPLALKEARPLPSSD
ncbi:MAG: hypothetical protein ACYDAD_11880 [Acidimicrobiales bacterium]